MRRDLLLLRVAGTVELLTLAVLLINLATAHRPGVAAAVGPTHGCAYLLVVIAALCEGGAPARARVLAFVPGAGGLLALREIQRWRASTQ